MYRILLPVCALLLASSPAAAQHEHHPGTAATPTLVSGTVLGAEGTPLAGAIVQLFHGSGTGRHVMATSLTDGAGRFAIRVGGGSYTLEVSYLGHEPHTRPVSVGASPVAVGPLHLQFSPLALDALTAAADRAAVQLRSGAAVVDADRAAAAAGASIAELLRTVPGVEMDAAGRITMRGSSSVLVLMNGRRIPLSEDALVAFLKQMPASALERVEAGTSVSARHDADGMAGVVNLVFRSDAGRPAGTRSMAGSLATEDHYMVSAAATGATGAMNWDAMYSYSAMRPRTDSRTERLSLIPADPVRNSDQESSGRALHRLPSVMGGTEWSATPSLALGARGSYAWMEGAYRNSTDFLNTAPDGATRSSLTSSILEHTIPSGDAAATAEWRRGSGRVAVEAGSSFVREDFAGDYRHASGHAFLNTTMASRLQENVLRSSAGLDAAGMRLEAGHALQRRTLTATYLVDHGNVQEHHRFRYGSTVNAAYLTATASLAGADVEGGIRGEADGTTVEMASLTRRSEFRLFPSLQAQWPGDGGTSFRAAYGRRLNRPTGASLNPYSMGEDDMNEIVGNPFLRPEVSDQLELGVETTRAGFAMQVTPFARYTRDPIRPLKAVTATGRSTTTLENLGSTRAAGAEASVRGSVHDGLTLTLAGSAYWMETRGTGYRTDGLYATGRLTLDARLAEHTTAHLYAYRRGAQAIEQGEIRASYTTEAALTHLLGAGDQGRLTLRLSDPLRSDRVAFRIADDTFVQSSSRRISRPLLSLFFSWAVGGTPPEDTPERREGPARIF
jgi:ferric enterobactin receptor